MKKSISNREIMCRQGLFKKSWRKSLLVQWWRNYHWLLWILGVLSVFYLGYCGFKKSLPGVNGQFPNLDILYQIIQLFVLNMDPKISHLNWQLEIARWLAPFIAGSAAAKALASIFWKQFQLFKIRFLRDHIIICGLGTKGLLLSREFRSNGCQVVVIELDEENNNINECRDSGAFVLMGNALVADYLNKAGLQKAKYLFSVCGNDMINAGIASLVREHVLEKRNKPLTVVVHIVEPQLCRCLKEREFETEKTDAFRLEFFNIFDWSAQILIGTFSPFTKGKVQSSLSPHILIVGVGKMGEAMVVHAAKKWKNFQDQNGLKLKISIIDKNAKQKTELLNLRYRSLGDICEVIPLEMGINSVEFESNQFLLDEKENCKFSIIYICFDNDSLALSTALALHHRLIKNNTPIIIRMEREAELASLIEGDSHGYGRLHAFGLLDRVLKPELLLMGSHEILARVIHEEYLKNQSKKGDTPETNPSLIPWDELSETLKDSNRRQADSVGVKLKSISCYIVPMTDWNAEPIDFTSDEIEVMAEIEHKEWVDYHLKNGWVYAPGPKNRDKKTHHCLIPWEELPEVERQKDRDTVQKIPYYLEKAGFQIYRRK